MLREFLKLGATCAALAVFFTPLEAARKITRERNVGALTPVPFGAIALNCSIWVVYGIIVRDWVPLVASNAVGSASGVYCLGVFARHAKPPLQLRKPRVRDTLIKNYLCRQSAELRSKEAMARAKKTWREATIADKAGCPSTGDRQPAGKLRALPGERLGAEVERCGCVNIGAIASARVKR